MRFQRLVAETVAVFTCLAFVAGCTSSPSEPEPLPEPTRSSAASASPSPSPTATPPTLPAEADGTSPAAAKAFARYYVQLFNYATTTGDTAPVRGASRKECSVCHAMLERIDDVYAAGGYFEGAGWKIRNVRYEPFQPRRQPVVSVGVRVSPQTMVERKGAAAKHFDGGRNQFTVRLAHAQDQWSVRGFEALQ